MSDILIALVGGFWPMLPFFATSLLNRIDPTSAQSLQRFLWSDSLSLVQVLAGTSLILAGNALDIWGYSTLLRSFSIVPEARELRVTGPYRIVRHPVYLGQLAAQAGVWLVFANPNGFGIVFFGIFVALQLYRSRLEDHVLAETFGAVWHEWKSRTFWFC